MSNKPKHEEVTREEIERVVAARFKGLKTKKAVDEEVVKIMLLLAEVVRKAAK